MRMPRHALVTPLAALVLSAGLTGSARAADPTPWCPTARAHPWCDTALDPDTRADLLAAQLTEDERLALLSGTDQPGEYVTVPRLGLPALWFTGGPAGVPRGTALPAPIALAATFDTGAASRYGAVVGDEAVHRGATVVFGPSVDPASGWQAYGTDPYLAERLATQWTQAAQAQGVVAAVRGFPFQDPDSMAPLLAAQGGAGMVVCDDCESARDLTATLRGRLGFQGAVVADDVRAVTDTRAASSAGLDLMLPAAAAYAPPLLRFWLAVGGLDQAALDQHVHRVLRTLFAFGVLDRPAYRDDADAPAYGAAWAEHAQTALEVEKSAITLLKNDGALPLAATARIALIGPAAIGTAGTSGVSPRDGIARRGGVVTYTDGADQKTAVQAARAADVAIVFATDNGTDALIRKVAAANPDTVVVLETGGPLKTPWAGQVKAVVEAWYPGQAAGTALASVLFGDTDPGGRLPVAFPGFPFGYGLSYTTFAYRGLTVANGNVQATVANTGTSRGVAVPQLYLDGRLSGFTKVTLDPGETTQISFPAPGMTCQTLTLATLKSTC